MLRDRIILENRVVIIFLDNSAIWHYISGFGAKLTANLCDMLVFLL